MRVRRGTAGDVPRSIEIWRRAVDVTHQFLSAEHRAEIDPMVADEFLPNVDLWVVEDQQGAVAGFPW